MSNTMLSELDEIAEILATPPELLDQLPHPMRRIVESSQQQTKLRQVLDDPNMSLTDRVNAYFELAIRGRKRYRSGNEFANLTQLGKYLNRDHTCVRDMQTAVRVDTVNYSVLLCLAAIYPAPRIGQSHRGARIERLGMADAWLVDGLGISLSDQLHRLLQQVSP